MTEYMPFYDGLHIQKQVDAFHDATGAPRYALPPSTDEETYETWRDVKGVGSKLIEEEYNELMEAIKSEDFAAMVHEACDLLYVVAGLFVRIGVDAKVAFDAVHEKNMEKLGGPKREDGKQLKPEGFEPLDMSKVLNDYYGVVFND